MTGAQQRKALNGLIALGFHIALDDMGAGYSSLSDLCTYRFDYVKIDRSILLDAEEDARKGIACRFGAACSQHGYPERCLRVWKQRNSWILRACGGLRLHSGLLFLARPAEAGGGALSRAS